MPHIEPGTVLYVVVAEAGQWSEWTKWSVLAFLDETAAQTHVELAQQRANEIELFKTRRNEMYLRAVERSQQLGLDRPQAPDPNDPRLRNEYDPNMGNVPDYEVHYSIEEVQLAPERSVEPPAPQEDGQPSEDFWAILRADDA